MSLPYDREKAVAYAKEWALSRNPVYYDFENIGGDCTNFASQCVYAGTGVMNFTPDLGWFYININNRSAAWTGVQFFYQFMMNNQGSGPYATEVPIERAQPGDIIQLGREDGTFYHSLVVCAKKFGSIYICAHTYDAYMRPLDSYTYARNRCIHIEGYRP